MMAIQIWKIAKKEFGKYVCPSLMYTFLPFFSVYNVISKPCLSQPHGSKCCVIDEFLPLANICNIILLQDIVTKGSCK
jgi:hypothetical protein